MKELAISQALNGLTFEESNTFIETVFSTYSKKTFNNFRSFLKDLETVDERTSGIIARSSAAFSDQELMEFVVLPKISCLINYYSPENILTAARLFESRLDGMLAKKNGTFDITKYSGLFTPTTSHFISFDKSSNTFAVEELFNLCDGLTMDFISRDVYKSDKDIIQFPVDEFSDIHDLFTEIISPIEGTPALKFVLNFESVIVARKLSEASSSSLVSSTVDNLNRQMGLFSKDFKQQKHESLAEAMVHESIHSFLDQLEFCNPWMPTLKPTKTHYKTVKSPWTGNQINIGGIVQAIFVWFGLYNFWHYAFVNKLYTPTYSIERLAFIKKGFELFEPDSIFDYSELELSDDLMQTYSQMKLAVANK